MTALNFFSNTRVRSTAPPTIFPHSNLCSLLHTRRLFRRHHAGPLPRSCELANFYAIAVEFLHDAGNYFRDAPTDSILRKNTAILRCRMQ